jgi:hypothetical protein
MIAVAERAYAGLQGRPIYRVAKGSKISKPLWKGSIPQWWSSKKYRDTAGERERERREDTRKPYLMLPACHTAR